MFQDLAAATGASFWAIASMLFFVVVFAAVALSVLGGKRETYEHLARLPLDDDAPDVVAASEAGSVSQSGTGR